MKERNKQVGLEGRKDGRCVEESKDARWRGEERRKCENRVSL